MEALREAVAREDEELIAEENEELELQRQNESLLAELAALRHKYSSLEESMRVNDQKQPEISKSRPFGHPRLSQLRSH